MRQLASAVIYGCLLFGAVSVAGAADSPEDDEKYAAPHWALEFKGGKFKPDLELYEEFYGDDDNTMWAITGAYRFTNWLELGAELGYAKDKGVGFLPNAGAQGGEVEYTLMPFQVFLNFRYDRSLNQLFVPYAGIGIATAWYKQDIDEQSGREGRSDAGPAARVGVQWLLNRADKRGATYVRGDRRMRTFLFLEGQVFKTEVDDIDLGGEAYFLGLRFEWD
jgi:opacity protein-like surface antigen